MTAPNLAQEPGAMPLALPPGAALPRADGGWLRAWLAFRDRLRTTADRVAEAGLALSRGSVHLATVRHDDWCPALWTESALHCCCDATIEVGPDLSRKKP